MRTRFRLVCCAAVLALSQAAAAAENATAEPQLLLLHQPARAAVQISPETARARMLETQQQNSRTIYAQLFTDLQFRQSQIDALTRLMAEHVTLTTSWSSGGVNFTPQEADQQRANEVYSEIVQLLGPAGLQRFAEYQQTLGERFQLQRLVQLLAAVGYPLTSEQSSELVSIMKAQRALLEPYSTSSSATLEYAEDLVRRRDEFDRRVKPRFAVVLSQEQRDFVEEYFAGRAQRRHDALDAFRSLLADGSSAGFTYPAD